MGLSNTQLSLLEALDYLQQRQKAIDNRRLRRYYARSEGAGMQFFNHFSKEKTQSGILAHQKTIYLNIKALEKLGLVQVIRKTEGKLKKDYYKLTSVGFQELRKLRLKDISADFIRSYLCVIQSGLTTKLWAVDK